MNPFRIIQAEQDSFGFSPVSRLVSSAARRLMVTRLGLPGRTKKCVLGWPALFGTEGA
jgi:hypothetical protein